MHSRRILIIDGFRFIAIILVLFYHLTNPYTTSYPHSDFFLHFFKFGYLGVYFFFMISGFVINYTLENTPSFFSFLKNRMIRLFPAMICCTTFTFVMVSSLSHGDKMAAGQQIRNFLPSLTFTNPTLWTFAFGKPFHWINGSYWSLWVEVQFYTIASAVYYLGKKFFLRNFLLAAIFLILIKYIPNAVPNVKYQWFATAIRFLTETINITFNIGWFCIGIFFFQLFKHFKFKINEFAIYGFAVILICQVKDIFEFYPNAKVMLVCLIIMCFLFTLMIYRGHLLSALQNRLITRIGRISYSIYLIHEVAGVLLINKFGSDLGNLSFLSPFLIILLTIAFAEVSYRYYESKIGLLLKRAVDNIRSSKY